MTFYHQHIYHRKLLSQINGTNYHVKITATVTMKSNLECDTMLKSILVEKMYCKSEVVCKFTDAIDIYRHIFEKCIWIRQL